MRVLFFSDLHAHNFGAFATTLQGGRNSRLQNILDVLDEIATYCETHRVDYVFMLGDVFHSRTKIDADVYTATWMGFKKIAESVRERLFIVTGNHDQYTKDGTIHSLEPFRAFARVIDRPVVEKINTWRMPEASGGFGPLVSGTIIFAAHPFTTNIDEWKRFVRMVPEVDFFLFHQGVNEAKVGAFDISIKAEVAVEDFPIGATRCIGGHYHKGQWFGSRRHIGYVGSPLQHNFGERNDGIKGWLVLDDDDGRPNWNVELVESSAPKFEVYETYDEFLESDYDSDRCFAKVKCSTQEEIEDLVERFPSVQAELTNARVEESRIEASVTGTDEKLLSAYINQQEHDLDEDRLLSMGLGLIQGGDE